MWAWPGIADVAEPEVAQVGVERLFEPNFFQKRADFLQEFLLKNISRIYTNFYSC